jgi:uncharacterized protein (DUF305 family)
LTADGSRIRRVEVVAVAVAVLIAAGGGGFLLGARFSEEPDGASPGSESVEAGFLRDMQVHHAQAVQMSVIVRDRTTDPEVRTLALDIQLSQQQQIGQMYGWLADWGLPQTDTEPAMAWMTNGDEIGDPHAPDDMGSTGAMPGMATAADLERLQGLRGRDAERLYLQLMIPHHQAGIEMAEYALANATDPQVQNLAQRIVQAQTAEIKALQDMLDDRGGPLP